MVLRGLLTCFLICIATVITPVELKEAHEYSAHNSSDENSEISVLTDDEDRCSLSGIPCISFCCPFGSYVDFDTCSEVQDVNISLPIFWDLIDGVPESEEVSIDEKSFRFQVWNPCKGFPRYFLEPDYPDDESVLLKTGSLYKVNTKEIINYTDYCFGGIRNQSEFGIVVCYRPESPVSEDAVMQGTQVKMNIEFR